jgi:hypothetical protein
MAPMGTCAGAWYFHLRILRRRLGFVCRGPIACLVLSWLIAPVSPLSLLAKGANRLTGTDTRTTVPSA